MAKRKEVHEWLKDDPKQVAWAKEYLRKKGLLPPNAEGHAWLIRVVGTLDTETSRSLRAAWNQQVSKEKGNKKTRSFTLSDEAIKVLGQLARQQRCSQVHVIEELLKDANQFKTAMQQRQEGKQKPPQNIDRLTKSQQQKIGGLKRMLQEWQVQVDALLSVGARYRVALKAAGLLNKNLDPDLNPDQKEKAAKLQARWKDALTKSVEANTQLVRSLTRTLDQPTDK